MDAVIKCPNCGTDIQLSDAFRKEIETQIRATEHERHENELAAARASAEETATKKAARDFEAYEASLRLENTEEKERSARLLNQLGDMTEEMRALRRKDEERELTYRQQLATEESRIRQETRRTVTEEYNLKDREKDMSLASALKQVDELKAKMQQGSQQAQGEAMELELEEILRDEFRYDEITEIKKGQRGADVLQKVIDRKGRACGTILWESKNAQWSEAWLAKLRGDQRDAKVQIGVLVAAHPPADVETFLYRDGLWIVRRRYAKELGLLLRFSLIEVYAERMNHAGKDEKMEELYNYLTSMEFQHRVHAIVEGFLYLLGDVEREKRWFTTKWARQEKEIRKIVDSTQGMYGDLQAVTGRSLPAIPALELSAPADTQIVALAPETSLSRAE